MDIMVSLYPIIVVQSRYGGTYEGGEWHAIPNADAAWSWSDAYTEYMFGGDEDAIDFWYSDEAKIVGRGGTPNAAVLDLIERHTGVGQWGYDNEPTAIRETSEARTGSADGQADAEASGLLP